MQGAGESRFGGMRSPSGFQEPDFGRAYEANRSEAKSSTSSRAGPKSGPPPRKPPSSPSQSVTQKIPDSTALDSALAAHESTWTRFEASQTTGIRYNDVPWPDHSKATSDALLV